MKHKLSASALSSFLKSPKAYYWHYVARLQPIIQSTTNFDEAKLFGILWSEYVDRFYKGVGEAENVSMTLHKWKEGTDGWVPAKTQERLTKALESLMPQYYQQFSPTDGVRTAEGSELWIEDDTFCGRLDGISEDGIIHEVKSTSRAPQLAEQQWKVSNSLQVKLYCVLMDAKGYRIEFAYKDTPYSIFRGPIVNVTKQQKQQWQQELYTLAANIYSLGEDPNNYPCHPDGCCMVSKNMVSMCQYQLLCDQGLNEVTSVFYKTKAEHK